MAFAVAVWDAWFVNQENGTGVVDLLTSQVPFFVWRGRMFITKLTKAPSWLRLMP